MVASLALHSKLPVDLKFSERVAVICASADGCLTTDAAFYRGVQRGEASPRLFAYTLHSSPRRSGQHSARLYRTGLHAGGQPGDWPAGAVCGAGPAGCAGRPMPAWSCPVMSRRCPVSPIERPPCCFAVGGRAVSAWRGHAARRLRGLPIGAGKRLCRPVSRAFPLAPAAARSTDHPGRRTAAGDAGGSLLGHGEPRLDGFLLTALDASGQAAAAWLTVGSLATV